MSIANEVLSAGSNLASGNITGAVNKLGNAVSGGIGIAKKIGNLVSKDDTTPTHIRDIYTNGFHAVNGDSVFKPILFARAFDEPTYLTFRIEFCFDDPLRNMMYNETNTGISTNWNYAHMYDYMPEPFLQARNVQNASTTELTQQMRADVASGALSLLSSVMDGKYINQSTASANEQSVNNLISPDKSFEIMTQGSTSIGNTMSTSDYLLNALGDYGRHTMLDLFIAGLKDMQENYPFYFTNISGLSSLSKIDPKRGSRLKDAKISIECYEALDLRITQLMQLYRKIVWDDVYQRWILPDMMRYFSMKIYVSEIRLFHEMRGSVGKSKNPRLIDMNEDRNNVRFMGKKNVLNQIVSGLNIASAAATAFTGSNNLLTNAIGSAAGVANTVNQIQDEIAGFYTRLCNNAINKVMPTICYDCHMCEFDITDMMGYVDSLQSSAKGISSPKPKITINVGQVTETQVYPLNVMLEYNDSLDGYSVLKSLDDNRLMGGAILSDDALNKPLTKEARRVGGDKYQESYVSNIKDTIDHDGTENINMPLWRFGKNERGVGAAVLGDDANKKLMYNIDDPGDMLAATALSTAALNETGELIGGLMGNSGIFSKSEATNPNNAAAVQAKNFALQGNGESTVHDQRSVESIYETTSSSRISDMAITDDVYTASGLNNDKPVQPAGKQLPDADASQSATEIGNLNGKDNEYILNPYEGLNVPQETIWPDGNEYSATNPDDLQLQQAENFEIKDNGDPVFPPEPNIWEEKTEYNATNPTPSELQQAENFSINDPGYTPIDANAKIWNDKAEYTATEPSEDELQQAENFSINDPGYTPINTEPKIWDDDYKSTATNPDETQLQQAKNFEIESAKDILVAIAQKIWDSPEIKSMATSDEMREQVAESVFNNVLNEIYKSSATDERSEAMRTVIQAYRNNGQ